MGENELAQELEKTRTALEQLRKDCAAGVADKEQSIIRLTALFNQERARQAEINSKKCVDDFMNGYNSAPCKEAIKKKICA